MEISRGGGRVKVVGIPGEYAKMWGKNGIFKGVNAKKWKNPGGVKKKSSKKLISSTGGTTIFSLKGPL